MTYVFQGVLTHQDLSRETLGVEFVFRQLEDCGIRSGVRFLASFIDRRDDALSYLRKLPIREEAMYVSYVTWGGMLDDVEGFRFLHNAVVPGSEFHSKEGDPEAVFQKQFNDYGIALGENGHFEPFTRGYWGSAQYDYPR